MDSTQKKIALCLAATAFTGFGLYQVWKSRKRRETKDAVAALVSNFSGRPKKRLVGLMFGPKF